MKPLLRPALLLCGLIVGGLALRLLPADGAAGLLRAAIDPAAHGWAGSVALFIAAGAAFCAVGVPRQVVAYAAGFAFGTPWGTLLALAAMVAACGADFWWARWVGRSWARKAVARGPMGRLARLDRFIAANPFISTLMLRLLPVGNNLALNLLAGVSAIPAAPFVAASALGYLPQTVIFALIGSGARVERPTQIAVGVALFLLSGAAGLVLMRRLANADGPHARYAAIPPR